MSHKKGREQVGVALFPFLAVLICTMGALIVLLVLLVQQARVDATAVTQAKIGGGEAEADKALKERVEDAEWRRDLLEKSREEKAHELADARARLAHFEEHTKRLAARAKELLEQARAIDEGSKPADELAAERAELTRLKQEIDRRSKELEEAKKRQHDGRESYALIPYEGGAGTRRRPIYVECTEFGVIVQPEGILLRTEDFMGPLGPGNPLDVTLRAIREHHERTLGPKAGQPYPLLVVRPGGIMAYGAARAAMKAWDDEFGYELISDDKHLDFGEANPALAESLARTVAVARQRQAAIAAMMPRKYQDEPLPSYGASSRASEPTGTAAGGSFGGGTAPAGNGIGGSGTPGSGPLPGIGGGAGGGGTDRFGLPGNGTHSNGIQSSGMQSSSAGLAGAGTSSWPSAKPSAGQTGDTGSGAAYGAANSAVSGSAAGASLAGAPQAGGRAPAVGTSGPPSGGSSFSPGTSGSSFAGQPGGGTGSAGGAMSASPLSGGQPTIALPTFGQNGSQSKTASGSSNSGSKPGGRGNSRTGKNWALPQAKPNAIGVTRPIRISVLPDRIVLAPEQLDRRAPQSVPIAPELTPDDVTHLVDAVHREVDQWGLAVADGYWKPVLQAEVAPGCERHYENLRTALSGSGLDIIRR